MPIHDWTRVGDGTLHAFHVSWVSELQESLNSGLLPSPYYAQAEQIVGPLGPDVLTLQTNGYPASEVVGGGQGGSGGLAVATVRPHPRLTVTTTMDDYVLKRRTIVIRHSSGDRIIALLEILSPGNKSSRHALRSFVEKAVEALYRGYHLLIVDLFPPTSRDPQGIHGAIWREVSDDAFELPADEPLTLAAYSAGPVKQAWVEPTAVGRTLIEMPLFLEPEIYVNVPLEATYQAAYRGVARRWKEVLG
jgi:hypothetical protein